MASPFEDVNAEYLVLGNHRGQYSLWPAASPVPNGWIVRHPAGERAACLAHVEVSSPHLAVVATGHASEAVCLSQIFEERASANPDAVAVEFGATRMSYAE